MDSTKTAPLLTPELAKILDDWWEHHMPGSVVARHTEAWNHLHRAFGDLKQRLAATSQKGA